MQTICQLQQQSCEHICTAAHRAWVVDSKERAEAVETANVIGQVQGLSCVCTYKCIDNEHDNQVRHLPHVYDRDITHHPQYQSMCSESIASSLEYLRGYWNPVVLDIEPREPGRRVRLDWRTSAYEEASLGWESNTNANVYAVATDTHTSIDYM